METIFDLTFEGELDDVAVGRFQKLLDLKPRGRLDDTEDRQFGYRTLRASGEERVWLSFWRLHGSRWVAILAHTGPRPPDELVAQCREAVLSAAGAVGLTLALSSPEPVDDRAREEPHLPSRRALSMRFDGERMLGQLRLDLVHRLQDGLRLEPELGGVSGTEYGWRYVRFDPEAGSWLLQLYDDPRAGTEVALLYEHQSPDDEVVAGCRLQATVAGAQAGLTLVAQDPEPVGEVTADWAAIARRAAGVGTLAEVLGLVGSSDETAYELSRGRVLAVTDRPEWAAAPPRLRQDVDDFLLGLPLDRG